jgi:hypothetical protein
MNGKGDRSRVGNWAVYRDNYDSIFGGGEVSDILERLRGYNPLDRTSDNIRAAQDISDAADEIGMLRNENLSLYRVLTKSSPVSPEIQRLQEIMDGVCVPGGCLLTSAADEITLLRGLLREACGGWNCDTDWAARVTAALERKQ